MPNELPRKKDISETYKQYYHGLSDNMKGFLNDAYNSLGITFTLTSGKREPTGRFSHHHNGDAIDFKADEYSNYNKLYNTREGLTILSKYNLGIIDETDPEMLRKTGGTGAHFHIGKDSKFSKNVKDRLLSESFDFVPSYVESGGNVSTSNETHFKEDGHNHSNNFNYVPQQYNYKEYEKDIIRIDKEESQPYRKELTVANEEQKVVNNVKEDFLKIINYKDNLTDVSNLSYSNSQEPLPIEEVNLNQYIQPPSQFIFNV